MLKNPVKLYHLFFGLLDLVALSAAFYYSLNVLGYYFSYFTILSNILITAVYLYLGFFVNKKMPDFLDKIYGASVLYMVITGVVFWTILRNNHTLATIPWINLIIHGVVPVAVFLGWFLYPAQRKIKISESFKWLIPPLIFVGYTLIRGPIVHWYPYPFLNPALVGGYMGVALWVLGILVGAWIISLFLIWTSNLKQTKGR